MVPPYRRVARTARSVIAGRGAEATERHLLGVRHPSGDMEDRLSNAARSRDPIDHPVVVARTWVSIWAVSGIRRSSALPAYAVPLERVRDTHLRSIH